MMNNFKNALFFTVNILATRFVEEIVTGPVARLGIGFLLLSMLRSNIGALSLSTREN